jgi:hypothetical protein
MKIVKLTREGFDILSSRTRLKARARDLARHVLVDGQEQSATATEFGVAGQHVNKAVSVVLREFDDAYTQGSISGTQAFAKADLALPAHVALEIDKLALFLERSDDINKDSEAVISVLKTIMSLRTNSP